jgi:hypothetical protein
MIIEGAIVLLLAGAVVVGWGLSGFELATGVVMAGAGIFFLVCPFVPWPEKGFGVQPSSLTGLAMGGGFFGQGVIAGATAVGVLVPYSDTLRLVTTVMIVLGFISLFQQYSKSKDDEGGNTVRTN